jgi:hypothetical protein
MDKINWTRVLFGGLAGGLVWMILGTVRAIVLGGVGSSGGGPRITGTAGPEYLWTATATCVVFACMAGALYASIRRLYGPGPVTALRAGVALGLAIELTDLLWLTGTSASLEYRIWAVTSGVAVATVVALLAGWIYRESATTEA